MTSSPFSPDEMRWRLSALNPEAGAHSIPERATDLARALRCSAAAWDRFPYLEMRYGERGRRFTNSDSCWLVSLYDLDETLILGNLRWLRTVLSSRGIPSVILEEQLRQIDGDFEATEGERWHSATGFRTTLEQLRVEGDTLLDQRRRHELVSDWQARFDTSTGHRVRDAADLLISARLDEASGVHRAWAASHSWFVDPQMFSSEWIENVNALTDELNVEVGQ